MFGLLVKLAVLFGVIGGISYALARTFFSRKQDRILEELKSARDDLAQLRQKLADGELSEREHDTLAMEIYRSAKDRGVPLDEEELHSSEGDET